MTNYDFDLGQERNLRLATNLPESQSHEFEKIANTVARSYDFIEQTTGGKLKKGVLLYLLEFDTLPIAYRFEATYRSDSPWQEVRVVLLNKGERLSGPHGSAKLAELLYDTLPHELGHDVLADIAPLLHDIDGAPSYHTRWFIEGVCEFLAKGFARHTAPESVDRFLALRHIDTVLLSDSIREGLFHWTQQNNNGMALESDLYGASMLVVMAWTEKIELQDLLTRIDQSAVSLDGLGLENLLKSTTGFNRSAAMERAHNIGTELTEGHYVSSAELEQRSDS
jgi:hypothetical protein